MATGLRPALVTIRVLCCATVPTSLVSKSAPSELALSHLTHASPLESLLAGILLRNCCLVNRRRKVIQTAFWCVTRSSSSSWSVRRTVRELKRWTRWQLLKTRQKHSRIRLPANERKSRASSTMKLQSKTLKLKLNNCQSLL